MNQSSIEKAHSTMPTKPTLKAIIRNPIHFIACGFGFGLLPFMPGTFGTLVAIPMYLMMQHLTLPVYALITLIITLVGIPLCDIASRDLGQHDHPNVVWDEIAGYLITMFAAPEGWLWILIGFGLFRLFDIAKPWPIGWLDKNVPGGFGVMIDDVVAGVVSAILLQAIARFWFI